jgi:hypothetical protein
MLEAISLDVVRAAAAPEDNLTIPEILRFFAPLAATSVLMMASHSLAAATLAKASDAALALASYSVASALGQMFEGTVTVGRHATLALVRDRQTWSVMTRLMKLVLAVLLVVMAVVAFTPIGEVIFRSLLGAPADVAAEAVRVFRFFLILPAESALRALYHAIIILRKKTVYTTAAMAGRIVVMAGVTGVIIAHPPGIGGGVGAVVLLSGIGTEAVISYLAGRRLVAALDGGGPAASFAPAAPALTLRDAMRFYLPLAVSGLISCTSRLALAAGLSRTLDPKLALAAYQVSWTVSWVFISPLNALHQVTAVFAKEPRAARQVRRFAMAAGVGASASIGLFVLSGAARHVFTRWIGVADGLVPSALWCVGLMALAPLVICFGELFMGALLVAGDSVAIGTGRTLYIAFTTLASLVGAAAAPGLGAALAPLALLAGYVAEATFLWSRARRLPIAAARSSYNSAKPLQSASSLAVPVTTSCSSPANRATE